MTVLSFAAAQSERRRKTHLANTEPWCGPCSDAAGERQYLAPHIHYTASGPETRFHCPECGEEFR